MQKVVEIDGIGEVVLIKKRRMRSLRLKIDVHNRPVVSLPSWVPYQTAVAFAKSKIDWIEKNRSAPKTNYTDNQAIGKFHRLKLINSEGALSTRVSNNLITLKAPANVSQAILTKKLRPSIEKALRIEAETLLPKRLAELASRYGFEYRSVEIKKLTRRWGSCSSHNEIVLNLFLMQLPWNLIDYVLLHELTHTQHHDHSKAFWAKLGEILPNAKDLRKEIRVYNTSA